MTAGTSSPAEFNPRYPNALALACVSCFVVILALPMLSGGWLAAPHGDQWSSGYAFDAWETAEWRAHGSIPLWNPMIMSGLPYIAVVTHGDVLYPTALLRAFLPAHVVMNLSFFLHYILAGWLTYLVLRRLHASWAGAVTAGVAYQLSGILLSLVHPGHDGKLFVSTMLPLAVLGLIIALRDRQWWGHLVLAGAVALCLLSPHVQATYYTLIAAGLFALYLTFGEPTTEPLGPRLVQLGLALAAVIAGFGIAMPQILPFIEYIPHSPRAGGYSVGYEGSTSYGIPWDHVPELFLAGFSGEAGTYWGTNPLKLHSEYLGLPVIALAILGWGDRRRRLVWWISGIGLLFLLISLGGATPFYRIWWTIMPYVRKTRAPGMVFFVVAFCVAALAAFGVTRLERGEGRGHPRAWLIAAGAIAFLAVVGVFGQMASGLAHPQRVAVAAAHAGAIRLWAIVGAAALAATALLAWGYTRGRLAAPVFALGLALVVGADLWRDGRRFWVYSDPPASGLYRPDPIITKLRSEPAPYRVLNFDAYPQNVLMAHGIPQVLGYQGQELRYYDDLLGGRNEWRLLLQSTQLWHLLAVRYVILSDTARLPGYHHVLGPVETAAGSIGHLYEADSAPPYARVATAAAKLEDAQIPPTLADPRLPGFDRVVLFAPDAPIDPPPLTGIPGPSPARARVTAWRPGAMTIELDPRPQAPSYVLVAENWYLDWQATVDGNPASVLRGDNSLLTVPVPAGAGRVELSYHSRTYETGKTISFATIGLLALIGLVPTVVRRRRA